METTAKRDHFAEVTERIIKSLEHGVVPWHQPWGFIEPAQNHFTGHKYRGINQLLMLITNYETPYFATIRQINEAGGRVKKGAKSSAVYFHDCIYKDAKTGARLNEEEARARLKAGDKNVSKYPYIRLFPVFNMQDVEGCPVKPVSHKGNSENQEIAVCADFVTGLNLGEKLLNSPTSGQAYYSKSKDRILMPELSRFESSEHYYATLYHELTHFTGHASRLNRATLTDALKFGDTNYSKEELVAELGACFLCNRHGINTASVEDNAASYIQGWLTKLRKDKRFVWDAASEAQAAFTFLMDCSEQAVTA
ncbi:MULTISPECIES: ArdC family protein [Spirosoma]|nr:MULTISPECIES: zincin-like metallopeptidase domain-containing protein [Spirosoma]